ncbi:MAG: hypothetical protein Ct9H300mP5_1150 [Candidatus Pelagibacterales bacterium]|nr:MAG: hypothetical protein Ct9H300mP5_1150 [Pelagibacterales bacterium]
MTNAEFKKLGIKTLPKKFSSSGRSIKEQKFQRSSW